jgi:hypothetical protein
MKSCPKTPTKKPKKGEGKINKITTTTITDNYPKRKKKFTFSKKREAHTTKQNKKKKKRSIIFTKGLKDTPTTKRKNNFQ